MRKLFIIFAFMFIGIPGIAISSENYTVSGEVFFKKDADLYVCLFTADQFKEYPKRELAPPQCQCFPMTPELKQAGRLDFSFDQVPKGIYGIVVFQDLNKNKKVDFEGFWPDEPFGTYRDQGPLWDLILWDLVEFKVEGDLKGIKIQM